MRDVFAGSLRLNHGLDNLTFFNMRNLFILLFTNLAWPQTAKIPKKLEISEDGGYTGFVVGISNTVARDYSLIKMLEERLQARAWKVLNEVFSKFEKIPILYIGHEIDLHS